MKKPKKVLITLGARRPPLQKLLKLGQYTWARRGLAENLGRIPHRFRDRAVLVKLKGFDKREKVKDIVKFLWRRRLRFATLEELLLLGIRYPHLQEKNFIVTFHEVRGKIVAIDLCGNKYYRGVYHSYVSPDTEFNELCLFTVVSLPPKRRRK